MTLELKKLKAQLAQVVAARLDMEVKLEELAQASARVSSGIEIQVNKEAELTGQIAQMEKNNV